MTNVMMWLFGIGLVLLLVGFAFEMATPAPTRGAKALEWLAGVLFLLAGFVWGTAALPADLYDYIHGRPPRGANVAGVKFEEHSIKFPPPTEIGARWVLITSETPSKGVFVTNETMSVPMTDRTVKVYMVFPDGRETTAVEIGKDGSVVASSAGGS